jgi:hypothetical protein
VTIAAPQTAPVRLGIPTRPGEPVRAVPARPVRASAVARRSLFLLGLGLVMLLVRIVIGIALVVSFAVAAGREAARRVRSLRGARRRNGPLRGSVVGEAPARR